MLTSCTPRSYTNGTEYTKPGASPRSGGKPGLGMVRLLGARLFLCLR